ncbi:MAG: YqgE/AlgH family protein [Pseudomonadota bacterium]
MASRQSSLAGKILIAMPGMTDDNFADTTVLVCAHSSEGAMGLITNKLADNMSFARLVDHLDLLDDGDAIEPVEAGSPDDCPVQIGGPVEPSRGFVLHTPDYFVDGSSVRVVGDICLTATVDILRTMAVGNGPQDAILALGYSAWEPGQLEQEIQANGWLHTDASTDLVFERAPEQKYTAAMDQLGIDPSFLITSGGRA